MNLVLLIFLILFSIAVVIPIVILGIISYIYTVSGYSATHFAGVIAANFRKNGVSIKRRKIGNSNYPIDTIESLTIMGIKPYGHLGD